MMLEALAKKLPQILQVFPTIRLVYLFGSQVTGNVGPMSDYDIAILLGPDEDLYATQAAFQHEIVKILKTDRVDVVILNRAPIELAYQVIAKGKLLYQQSNYIRVEYESDVLSRYPDWMYFLRKHELEAKYGLTLSLRILYEESVKGGTEGDQIA